MTYEEALEVIDNICPCVNKGCPDSDPIRQAELSQAIEVARADEFYVDMTIQSVLEDRAFGSYDERLEP